MMNKTKILQLFRKELELVLVLPTLLFALLGLLVLIPNYPYGVAFLYFFFPIQICFQLARENKDLEFSMALPVTRQEIVIAKHLIVALIQLIHLGSGMIFSLISSFLLNKAGNTVGLDANFTLFGLILIGYALFNSIFFPLHYKTGKKIAQGLLLGILAFVVFIVGMEAVVALVPSFKRTLDAIGGGYLWIRLLIFILGIIIYGIGMIFSIKIATKNFEKVSM